MENDSSKILAFVIVLFIIATSFYDGYKDVEHKYRYDEHGEYIDE